MTTILDVNLTPQSRWYWKLNSHLGPSSSDMANRYDITFNKIQNRKTAAREFCNLLWRYKINLLKVKLSTGHSANLGHERWASSHNLSTWIILAAFWRCIQIHLWPLLNCHHPKHSLKYPLFDHVVFHQSFHTFHPCYSQVVGPPSTSLCPSLLVSGKLLSSWLRTFHHSFDDIVKNEAIGSLWSWAVTTKS